MKNIIYINFILLFFVLFAHGQNDSIGVFIPIDDASPYDFKIKHMWVGLENKIASNYIGSDEFLKVWTDNGKVVKQKTNPEDEDDYYVIPAKTGKVKVFTIMIIWNPNQYWDTIKTCDSFTAIYPPTIITVVDDKYLKDSLDIKYYFIEASTKKENKRYQLGAFPPSILVYKNNRKIGEIFGFTQKDELRRFLVKGNRLHFPSFTIRDKETGLITGSNEFDYIIK